MTPEASFSHKQNKRKSCGFRLFFILYSQVT